MSMIYRTITATGVVPSDLIEDEDARHNCVKHVLDTLFDASDETLSVAISAGIPKEYVYHNGLQMLDHAEPAVIGGNDVYVFRIKLDVCIKETYLQQWGTPIPQLLGIPAANTTPQSGVH